MYIVLHIALISIYKGITLLIDDYVCNLTSESIYKIRLKYHFILLRSVCTKIIISHIIGQIKKPQRKIEKMERSNVRY